MSPSGAVSVLALCLPGLLFDRGFTLARGIPLTLARGLPLTLAPGLSLGSACRFRFRRRNGDRWERHTLEAAPRSLYMMDGEARSQWEHSIPPVEARRYSITFRTMKPA